MIYAPYSWVKTTTFQRTVGQDFFTVIPLNILTHVCIFPMWNIYQLMNDQKSSENKKQKNFFGPLSKTCFPFIGKSVESKLLLVYLNQMTYNQYMLLKTHCVMIWAQNLIILDSKLQFGNNCKPTVVLSFHYY